MKEEIAAEEIQLLRAETDAKRGPEEREGQRVDERRDQVFGRKEVWCHDAGEKPSEFIPGVDGCNLQIGEDQKYQCDREEREEGPREWGSPVEACRCTHDL